jgi:hypothetical protein
MRKNDLIQIQGIGFKVHDEVFEIALVGSTEATVGAFAEVDYCGERTVIRAVSDGESAFGGRAHRMISFTGDLPLDLVGFLALVSGALAERKIPIFVISSYRTDHVLMLERDLEKGIEALGSLGMTRQA